ncbi:MAG: hypothetical protein MSH25_05885, partial [Desulfovibrio sp.]|uniref:hypothetical protein n=1 Tax=Desulfovibrio sp. TaxID=885 RepID=UPI0025C1D16A
AARFKPYGLSLRGKSAVFPLSSGRAALCRRLALYLFQKKCSCIAPGDGSRKKSSGVAAMPHPPE